MQSCRFDLCDRGRKCEAHPSAVCRINPCGGCSRDYYNSQNKVVQCTSKGRSKYSEHKTNEKSTRTIKAKISTLTLTL